MLRPVGAMQLLHPFMPFITETIWQALPHEGSVRHGIQLAGVRRKLNFSVEEAQMESLMDAVRAIRNRRAEMNVPPSKKAKVLILTEKKDTFSAGAGFFRSSLRIRDRADRRSSGGRCQDGIRSHRRRTDLYADGRPHRL